MKLISMTQKVFETFDNTLTVDFQVKVFNYANFLSKQLELGDFVPCDEDGNVLEEPLKENYLLKPEYQNNKGNIVDLVKWTKDFYKHKQAKDRVIFEGFEVDKMECGHKYAVNKDLQIVFEEGIGLYFNEIFQTHKPKKVFLKTIEDLVKYNLTITPQAIKRFNL